MEQATPDTIDQAALALMAEAGAIRGAEVIGQPGGWGVVVTYGRSKKALAARRGAIRVFRRFETLVGYLKDLGIAEYRVNAAEYAPAPVGKRAARPDSAERLRRAHKAAAYADWLEAKVTQSRAALAEGGNREILPDEWARIRAAKKAGAPA
jgi:hypothetical protein